MSGPDGAVVSSAGASGVIGSATGASGVVSSAGACVSSPIGAVVGSSAMVVLS